MRDYATPDSKRLPLGERYPPGMDRSHSDQQTEGQTESETPAPASAGRRVSHAWKSGAGIVSKGGWGRPDAYQAGRALRWRLL